MKGVFILIGAVLGLALLLMLNPFALVAAGHRGVVLNWGAVTADVLGEGMHWRTPIVQKVVTVDVRIQKEETEAAAATKDLQTVSSKIALNFHVAPERVANIYQTIGVDFKNQMIAPALQEAIKASTAKFTAEELVTKREAVREDIKMQVKAKLEPHGFIVDEFNITDFDFSAQFNSAIEAKVTAEQSALAAKNKLEQVKFEAEQRVTQAKAEAEAIQIQAAAITQQGGENYVQLKAVEKWNGKLPDQMIPGAALPFINLTK